MPKLLFLQLLTNSLNASVNYMSDVYEPPVTKHHRKKQTPKLLNRGSDSMCIIVNMSQYVKYCD